MSPNRPEPAPDYSGVSVVIPALDEERALPLVLAELPPVGHVIVVDNGSRDHTARVAREHGAIVLSEPRRGYGNACLRGIAEATRLGARVLVVLDGDHSDYPGDLPLLVDPILDDRADMVLGDRTRLARRGALLPHQAAGNKLATALIATVTGHRYRDMGPFRAIRLDALRRLRMRDPNYGWNVEMQMRAVQQGLRIQEVPVRYRPRIGRSKVSGSARGAVAAGLKITWSVWRYARPLPPQG